ncbi:hypothetical protein [Nitrobacter sp. JJSN]|uniref:hypothetical protein n=1 Tax=Nitrobacter sp. JJSN TaxID=3453033 RepID=UPI003F76A405
MSELNNEIRELSDRDLDAVSGGFIKGALEGVCRNDERASGGQNDPAQMFQQILQQLTQGQG